MRGLALAFFLTTGALSQAQESTGGPFADGDRVLFLGDSITQSGEYVALIETYLWAAYPDRDVTVINMGVSAETVSGTTEPGHNPRPWVHDRVEPALEIARPDWVFICYGMNDGNYFPPRRDIQDAYQREMDRLLDRIAASEARVVLLTPPPFDPASKPENALVEPGAEVYGYSRTYRFYDDTLNQLAGTLIGAFGNRVDDIIDIHTPIKDYVRLQRVDGDSYRYGDGVHPPVDGHFVFASAILEGLGEDRSRVESTLTRVTGIARGDSDGTELWSAIRGRFNPLSRVYRDNTRPRSREDAPDLDEAVSRAKEQATRIRIGLKN